MYKQNIFVIIKLFGNIPKILSYITEKKKYIFKTRPIKYSHNKASDNVSKMFSNLKVFYAR